MHDAGVVLLSLIAVGAAASFVLRRLRHRTEQPVRGLTSFVTRVAIALFTGFEAFAAARRGGWFFWTLACSLGLLSAFSALLAVAIVWLLVSGGATDDDEGFERVWRAKRDGDVTALVRMMEDAHAPSSTRAFAARSLGRLKNPLASEPLAHALDDKDELVRSAAGDALRRLGAGRR